MSEAAITGAFVRLQTMADGTPRAIIDLHCKLEEAARIVGEPGQTLALARLTEEAAQSTLMHVHAPRESRAQPYGEQAKALKLSGFFRVPEVWHYVGSDMQFLGWLKGRRCARNDAMCFGDVVAAHVRRIADGAGTGIKPEYSAIPLCDAHHRLQHQHGESAIGGKEWCDAQRIKYVEAWAWDQFKFLFGVQSMADLDPARVRNVLGPHPIARYLPEAYR